MSLFVTGDTPPKSPDLTLVNTLNSPYHSKSVVVTVGPSRIPFTIHEAKLAQTCFFELHTPLSEEDRMSSRSTSLLSREIDCEVVAIENDTIHRAQWSKAGYHIDDRDSLSSAAFDVFAKYLYNEPPVKPASHDKVEILLKAYELAINYKCVGLQNKIINCLQQYYASTRVKLDDLRWCAKRFGDNNKCRLNAYLVEQIAFDIADAGYNAFLQSSPFAKRFIEEGDREIRGSLFEAVARYATTKSKQDPAKDMKKFSVPEIEANAGN